MEDEVVMHGLLRLLAMKQLQDNRLGQGIVLDTELLAAAQTMLKTRDGVLRAGYLHLVAARHHPHIRVLVLQTQDILVVHTIECSSVQRIVEGYN